MKNIKKLKLGKIKVDEDGDPTSPATPNTFKFFSVSRKLTSGQNNILQRYQISTTPPSAAGADKDICGDEFSDDSTMSMAYDQNKDQRPQSCWNKCCSKIDFWTLLAALLSVTGGILFTIFEHKALNITLVMLQEVMHVHFVWMQTFQALMTATGAITSAFTFLVFLASFISKGEFDDVKKPPSRTPSTIFLVALYPFICLWLFLMGTSIAFGLLSFVLEGVCETEEISGLWQGETPPIGSECKTTNQGEDCLNCINLYPFHFMFPSSARKEDMWMCGTEIVDLCSSNLPHILYYWITAFGGTILLVVGLSVHMMALSYNRTELGTLRRNQDYQQMIHVKARIQRAMSYKATGRKWAKRLSP